MWIGESWKAQIGIQTEWGDQIGKVKVEAIKIKVIARARSKAKAKG